MMSRKLTWAFPGIIFGALTLAAACDSSNSNGPLPLCADDTTSSTENTSSTGNGSGGAGGGTTNGGMGANLPTPETPTAQQVNARLHGCRKVRYSSLGQLLADRGVDLSSTATGSAGVLFRNGTDAFSVPKTDSRRGEKDGHTTASAIKLFDIFVQAAPEIIENLGDPQKAPACAINGMGIEMFDPVDGGCVEEAVSCLIGSPATEDHILLCNNIVDKANDANPTDVMRKQHIAVATLMSAAHSCE